MNGVIYIAINKVNGKMYVGQTTRDILKRIYRHMSNSNRGCKCAFYTAIRKYGWDNFDWCVLVDGIKSKDKLDELEI